MLQMPYRHLEFNEEYSKVSEANESPGEAVHSADHWEKFLRRNK
jgi:hypothetical protein